MSEKLYDEEIAPALLAIAKQCEEEGISMVAKCEFAPGSCGSTATVRETACASMRLVYYASEAQGNADRLILSLLNDGKKHGHNSVYLTLLENRENNHDN